MSHPLHEKCLMIECSYRFGFTVIAPNDDLWDIHLKETEQNGDIVAKHIWKSEDNTLFVELSTNNKQAIITFPDGVIRTVSISENKPPKLSSNDTIRHIKGKKEQKAEKQKFHELLKELGIEFKIDFCRYKEDSDYMQVFVNGESVFSGTTEDLKNK